MASGCIEVLVGAWDLTGTADLESTPDLSSIADLVGAALALRCPGSLVFSRWMAKYVGFSLTLKPCFGLRGLNSSGCFRIRDLCAPWFISTVLSSSSTGHRVSLST